MSETVDNAPARRVTREVSALMGRGGGFEQDGAWAEAERVYRRAIARLQRAAPRTQLLGRALTRLGWVRLQQGRYRSAARVFARAVEHAEQCSGRRSLDAAHALNGLGVCYKYLARFDEAAPLYQRALAIAKARGRGGELLATLHHNLGGLAHAAGRAADGERHAREAVRLRRRRLGRHHPALAADLAALAAVLDQQRKFAEAERMYLRAIAIFTRVYGADHIEIAVSLNNLAAIQQAQRRPAQAEAGYRRALAIAIREHGDSHPEVGFIANNLATLLLGRGKLEEAESLCRAAARIFEAQLGPRHPNLRVCLENYGKILRRLGRDRAAKPHAHFAARILAPD